MSTDIYHYEPVIENSGGFQLNQRACAVYKLAGFIHKTYRNAEGVELGKPVWSYVERGGKLTSIESEDSLEAVQTQLGGVPKPPPAMGATQSLGPLHRFFIGLHRQDGSPVDRDVVLELLATRLDTFTATETIGYYQGEREPTLIVEVATDDDVDLIPFAKVIADAFDQEAVGLESKGIYTRVFGERKSEQTSPAAEDRAKLNRFTGALREGKSFDELDAETQAWWLNRY